jgi:type I restriction enzyme S subunit
VTLLGEVADFEMGQAPPGAECNADGVGTLFVKAGEFGSPYPIEREWTTKPLKLGRRGDVFICVVGATAGKLNLGIDCAIGRSVAAIRPSSDIETKFLYYQLQPWVLKLRAASAGSAQGVISKKQLAEIPIELPKLDAQRRIVAEIEKQFSRLDEAVANLQRVKANLKRYKAGVLKAAIEGKLVTTQAELALHGGRPYETGDALLRMVLDQRRVRWTGRGKYKEPEPPRDEWQYELPSGWAWTTLGHIALSVKDGPHYSPKYADDGIPFISGGNIRPEGIDFSSVKFITPELHIKLSTRCRPEPGDLLYTKGGTTGIARINTESREFNVWVHVAVIKLSGLVHPFYVQHALNSRHCYRQAQEYTHGVGNQDLGLTRMVWITIPLPPRAEQDRIVAEVDRRLSIVREVEAEVDANLKRAQALRQAILSRAFTSVPETGQ